jgi:hypothetical protein
MRKLLAPIDGSDNSLRALKETAETGLVITKGDRPGDIRERHQSVVS